MQENRKIRNKIQSLIQNTVIFGNPWRFLCSITPNSDPILQNFTEVMVLDMKSAKLQLKKNF